jgi:hypothetical protein
MKKILYLAIFILYVHLSPAKPVGSNLAGQAAISYIAKIDSRFKDNNILLDNQSFYLYDAYVNNQNDSLYYVFKIKTGGWIIMSGDDKAEPVIGYSFESNFDKDNLPPSFISWISNIETEIEQIMISPDNSKLVDSKYQKLIKGEASEELQSSYPNIAPLVKTKWNQGYPYNLLCPLDEQKNQRAITGCVATAMAQLLNYYKFPLRGKGKNKYNHAEFGILETDFSKSEYKYNLMKNIQNEYKDDESRLAVAKLMSDCGVGVNMNYGLNASGAASYNVLIALKSFFGYSAGSSSCKPETTDEEWHELLYSNLSFGYPMYYAGHSAKLGSGHAFVCDGYENGKFHFNWGWGGSSDGYFFTGSKSASHQFNEGQEIIAYIIPSDMSLGTGEFTPDKFEPNNTPETATIIKPEFINDNLSFKHILNIHDTSDVDYFTLDLPDDENHYIMNLSFSNSFYPDDELSNASSVKVRIQNGSNEYLLYEPKVLILEKGGQFSLKIEPVFKLNHGTYIADITIYRYNNPFIEISNLNEDTLYSFSSTTVKWVSNLVPPFDIELVNDNKPGESFGKVTNIDDYQCNWQLSISLPTDNNYRFKITNNLDSKIAGISKPFSVKQKEYLFIEEPHWATDVHAGIPRNIIWVTNFNENITIELQRQGHFYQYIATNVENSGLYTWDVSDSITIGEGYQIKLSKFDDDRIFVISEDFIIQPFTDVEDLTEINLLHLILPDNHNITLNLKFNEPDKLILFDGLGRKITEYPSFYLNSDNYWQVPALPKGVYYIQEIYGREIKTHKVIF